MENKNLSIWEKVQKTNPKHTKQANVGGRTMTSINPTFQIKQATQIFGSYGAGFGLENTNFEYKEFGTTTLLILHCDFFYKVDDTKHSFPLSGAIKMAYVSGKGREIIDDDAHKKIETDLTTKALSKLGFSADVFMGKYDDVKYMNDIIKEFQEEESKEVKALINNCKKVDDLKVIYNNNVDLFGANPELMNLLTATKNKLNG